VDCKYP